MPSSPFESEQSFRDSLAGAFSPFNPFRQAWEGFESKKSGGGGGGSDLGAFLFPMEKLLGKTFKMMEDEINSALHSDIYNSGARGRRR